MKVNKMEKGIFLSLVIILSIIGIFGIYRTLRSVKESEDCIKKEIHDTIPVLYKDPEFEKLVDTVIVTQEKIKNEYLYQVPSETRDSLNHLNHLVDNLIKKLQQSKVEKVKVDTVYVTITPPSTPLDTKKVRSLWSDDYHMNKNEIHIHTISIPRFGLGVSGGIGGMYGLDDKNFHYGPYFGAGIYYKF